MIAILFGLSMVLHDLEPAPAAKGGPAAAPTSAPR
jgi:hypothetical protein